MKKRKLGSNGTVVSAIGIGAMSFSDFYGPTNFMTILKQSTPHGLGVRVPALKLLLGDGVRDALDPRLRKTI